jgi:AcrR family transcriptional regulator
MADKRVPLGPKEFMNAAMILVDKNGIAALSMRALGAELGVDATAIYRHFPNKDSLVVALIDEMLGEAISEPIAEGLPARDKCVAIALALRNAFRRHPDIGISLVHSEGVSNNGLELSRRAVQYLREMGLTGINLVRQYQAFEGYIMGCCVMDFSGSPHNFDIRRARYRLVDAQELDEAARDVSIVQNLAEEGFIESLNAILDRCEQLARKKS